jgi:hypothetical protein
MNILNVPTRMICGGVGVHSHGELYGRCVFLLLTQMVMPDPCPWFPPIEVKLRCQHNGIWPNTFHRAIVVTFLARESNLVVGLAQWTNRLKSSRRTKHNNNDIIIVMHQKTEKAFVVSGETTTTTVLTTSSLV